MRQPEQEHGRDSTAQVAAAKAESSKMESLEEMLAWPDRNNPNMATNRPQDVDWQALKAEARLSPCE